MITLNDVTKRMDGKTFNTYSVSDLCDSIEDMKEKIELRAVSAPWHCGVELLVRQGNSYGTNIILDPIQEGSVLEPTMRIDMDAAQLLMDDLWRSGLRPTEGSGSAGSLRATEKHLNDMRKIVFKKLAIDS